MKLSIGFINYNNNTLKYLSYFLESLDKSLAFLSDKEYQIICWDNSNNDDPSNRFAIEQYNHSHSKVIQYYTKGVNLGFSKAYNILINKAIVKHSKYFLVINPDIILDKQCISKLITALDVDNSLASVSPKILRWDFENNKKTNYIDSCGIVLKEGLRFYDLGQGEMDNGQYDIHDILGPSGALAMFRVEALKNIIKNKQYFDERFFMYKEDCDLDYRLYLASYKSTLIPDALAYHDRTVSSSKGFFNSLKQRKLRRKDLRTYSFLSQHLLFFKYWSVENIVSKLIIIVRIKLLFLFALLFEPFLLSQYRKIWNSIKKN